MDTNSLQTDDLDDFLTTSALYSVELWIERVEIHTGKHRNMPEQNEKISTIDEKQQISEKKNSKVTNGREKIDNNVDTNEKLSEENENGEKIKKSVTFSLNNVNEEFTLPSGQKPLRVKFNVFNIKNITLKQVDYDKILRYRRQLHTSDSNIEDQSIKKSLNERYSFKGLNSLTEESENFVKEQELIKTENQETVELEKGNDEKRMSRSSEHLKPSLETRKSSLQMESEEITKSNIKRMRLRQTSFRHSKAYIFYKDEILNWIDESVFLPKNEWLLKKGGNVTFTMAPMILMRAMQRGPLALSIDRFGGATDADGDPVGVTKVPFPNEWCEVVYKTARNPLKSPTIVKVVNNVPIEESPGLIIGSMEYTLLLTCYAGCVVTQGMPTQVGLYLSLVDGVETSSQLCHHPTNRPNINYQPIKRKAIEEDYNNLFLPSLKMPNI